MKYGKADPPPPPQDKVFFEFTWDEARVLRLIVDEWLTPRRGDGPLPRGECEIADDIIKTMDDLGVTNWQLIFA